jgi:alpha-L-fucosidase
MSEYKPNQQSLQSHCVPEWFQDAKLGIFIHWGPYSVPGWADPDHDRTYAEWYPFEMHREGSPTQQYHSETYGDNISYLDFIRKWTADAWDPEAWASLFEEVGARYVVLTGEHHDGFPLWPSHYTKYNAGEMGPERDIVGDLCGAVRERGLKFAASYHANLNYYQPGFEGLFGHPDFHGETPEEAHPGAEYVDFMNAKHRELIRRYEPDLLWFDVPCADAEQLNSRKLIADYYNRAGKWGKEVAVNDRASTDDSTLAGTPDDSATELGGGDFATPEYTTFGEPKSFKWETCRGIGQSFGYNQNEGPEHHLTAADLVQLLVDVVSKNGNLLINVGPKADGTIPDLQREPLEGLGRWLDTNGEAIFGTRPWVVAEPVQTEVESRLTWTDGTLYLITFEWPGATLKLSKDDGIDPEILKGVQRLDGGLVNWISFSDGVQISLPSSPETKAPAYSFALQGVTKEDRESVTDGW